MMAAVLMTRPVVILMKRLEGLKRTMRAVVLMMGPIGPRRTMMAVVLRRLAGHMRAIMSAVLMMMLAEPMRAIMSAVLMMMLAEPMRAITSVVPMMMLAEPMRKLMTVAVLRLAVLRTALTLASRAGTTGLVLKKGSPVGQLYRNSLHPSLIDIRKRIKILRVYIAVRKLPQKFG